MNDEQHALLTDDAEDTDRLVAVVRQGLDKMQRISEAATWRKAARIARERHLSMLAEEFDLQAAQVERQMAPTTGGPV